MQFFAATLFDMDHTQGPSKKRKRYAGSYQDDWGRLFNGVIAPSKVDEHHAWCVVRARDVNISASGVYNVKSHVMSKLHEKNAAARPDDYLLHGEGECSRDGGDDGC